MAQVLWNCFVGFFSLVICNLPFPGEGGLQYLGCWESQDNRSIRRCSAEIPQILSQIPSVWHDWHGARADERCWTQAQPCCTARLPWKCSRLDIPLARSSFVHSCYAVLGPGSLSEAGGMKRAMWRLLETLLGPAEPEQGAVWPSLFRPQPDTARAGLTPFPAGVWSERPYVHYTVFNWWKHILLLEPLMGVSYFSVSMPLSAAWDTACSSVIGITQPELHILHFRLIQARFPLLGILGFLNLELWLTEWEQCEFTWCSN